MVDEQGSNDVGAISKYSLEGIRRLSQREYDQARPKEAWTKMAI